MSLDSTAAGTASGTAPASRAVTCATCGHPARSEVCGRCVRDASQAQHAAIVRGLQEQLASVRAELAAVLRDVEAVISTDGSRWRQLEASRRLAVVVERARLAGEPGAEAAGTEEAPGC